jgi:multiple sugar transport system substrate-binding protein
MTSLKMWQLGSVCGLLLLLVLCPAVSAEPTKVVMMSRADYQYPIFDEFMMDKFHKENPGIVIERLGLSSSEQQIKVYVAANQQLDICVVDPYVALGMARTGLAAELTEFVRREPRFSNWYPAILEAYTFRGNLYGLPRDLQLPGVFLNLNAYQEAGLAVPRGRWTYEDVKRNAVRLQKVDGQGNVTRWGWKMPTWRNWVPMVWGHGADFVDNWTDPTRFVANDSRMHEALGFMRSLVESGAIPGRADHGKKSATGGFVDQTNAMVNTNTLAMPLFRQIADFSWDVAHAPYGPAGRKPFFNALSWVMLSTARDKEATWRVINFMTSEVGMSAMVELLGVVPPDRRYAQYWVRLSETPANRAVLFDELDWAGYPGTLETNLFGIIERQTLAAVWGITPIGSAIEAMQQLANARLSELVKE